MSATQIVSIGYLVMLIGISFPMVGAMDDITHYGLPRHIAHELAS